MTGRTDKPLIASRFNIVRRNAAACLSHEEHRDFAGMVVRHPPTGRLISVDGWSETAVHLRMLRGYTSPYKPSEQEIKVHNMLYQITRIKRPMKQNWLESLFDWF